MKKILILSGGGVYGSFEMGIVSKLISEGKGGWSLITGVSIGSLNACYLSTIDKDKELNSLEDFKKLWFDIKENDILTKNYFLNGVSFYDSKKFKGYLNTLFTGRNSCRPVIIGATSLNKSESKTFSNSDIEKYGYADLIMSSTAIPIILPPYPFLDDVFVDGGLTSNILFYDAINYCIENFPNEDIEVDIIVCGKKIKEEKVDPTHLNIIKLIEKLIPIIKQEVEYSELLKNIKFPNNISVTVYQEKVDLSISLIDFTKIEELWNDGFTFANVETYKI
jgi:predicted patatin/cPLA2 family phospholipase